MTGFWGDVCAEAARDPDRRASCPCGNVGCCALRRHLPALPCPLSFGNVLDLCRFSLFLAGALSPFSSAHLWAVSGAGSVLCSYVNAVSSPETQLSSAGWGGSSHAPAGIQPPQPILPSSPPVPFFVTPPRCPAGTGGLSVPKPRPVLLGPFSTGHSHVLLVCAQWTGQPALVPVPVVRSPRSVLTADPMPPLTTLCSHLFLGRSGSQAQELLRSGFHSFLYTFIVKPHSV